MDFNISRIIKTTTNLLGQSYTLIQFTGYSASHNYYIPSEQLSGLPPTPPQTPTPEPRGPFLPHLPNTNELFLDYVLAIILQNRKTPAYNFSNIELSNYFRQPLNLDTNYLLVALYNNHYYILLVTNGNIYISDGVNYCLRPRNGLVSQLKRDYPAFNIIKCKVNNCQQRVDHCGSSAVLIALEFLRMIKFNHIMTELILRPDLKNKYNKRFHPVKSKTVNKQRDIAQTQSKNRCTNCNAFFRRSTNLKKHHKFCKA